MKTKLILFTIIATSLLFIKASFSQDAEKTNDKFVIILDVQQEYTLNSMTEEEAKALIASINKVVAITESKKLIYVKAAHKQLVLSFSSPFIYVSIDTAAKWDLDKRLIIAPESKCFSKDEGDAFSSTALCDFLEANHAKEILVVGLLAEECMQETVLGGLEKGYDMYVIPEAVVGKTPESKKEVILELKEKGAHVLALDQLLAQ